MPSLRVNLLARFRGFFRSLLHSPSLEVQVVARLAARDMRSTLGSNLELLREETGLDPWAASPAHLKEALIAAERAEIPRNEGWRIPFLQKLLQQRLASFYSGMLRKRKHLAL